MKTLAVTAAAIGGTVLFLAGGTGLASDTGQGWSGADRLLLAQATADERRIQRLLNPPVPGVAPQAVLPPDPAVRLQREQERLLQDPAVRLGLPSNPSLSIPSQPEAAPTPPGLPAELDRLDGNRDGAISRSEYFRGRDRMVPAGPAGDARQRQLIQRLDSRFRDADRNRDGYVTPQELGESGNPRF